MDPTVLARNDALGAQNRAVSEIAERRERVADLLCREGLGSFRTVADENVVRVMVAVVVIFILLQMKICQLC